MNRGDAAGRDADSPRRRVNQEPGPRRGRTKETGAAFAPTRSQPDSGRTSSSSAPRCPRGSARLYPGSVSSAVSDSKGASSAWCRRQRTRARRCPINSATAPARSNFERRRHRFRRSWQHWTAGVALQGPTVEPAATPRAARAGRRIFETRSLCAERACSCRRVGGIPQAHGACLRVTRKARTDGQDFRSVEARGGPRTRRRSTRGRRLRGSRLENRRCRYS